MEYIRSKDIYLLMRDILKLINPTLMEHGSRVAYIVYKMLQEENRYEEFELADIVMVATMHDIGAYKTEKSRINDMLQYETRDSMAHSIYGSLFFKYLPGAGHVKSVDVPLPGLREAADGRLRI